MAVPPLGRPLGLGASARAGRPQRLASLPKHGASIGWGCLIQGLARALDKGRGPSLCKCQLLP